MRTNYNMSFLKETLLDKGEKRYKGNDRRYKYTFVCETDKLKIKGNYEVKMYFEEGYVDGCIVYEYMGVEIQRYEIKEEYGKGRYVKNCGDYYKLKIRLKDYETYGDVNLQSIGYSYKGRINNNELNEFAKVVRWMIENGKLGGLRAL